MFSMNDIKDWRLWFQLFKRRWYIPVLTCTMAILLGFYIALTTPSEYESVSTVMFIDTDLLSGSNLRFIPGTPGRRDLNYLRKLITSDEFLLKLKDRLDLSKNEKLLGMIKTLSAETQDTHLKLKIENQVFIKHVKKMISTRIKGYDIIYLKGRGRTPVEAYLLCQAFTNLAIEESQSDVLETVSEASSISNQLLDTYQKRLEEAEHDLEVFKNGKGLKVEQLLEITPAKLDEIQSIILATTVDLQKKSDVLRELSETISHLPPTLKSHIDNAINNSLKSILQQTGNVCHLFKKFSWRDREIVQINEEIINLKKMFVNSLRSYFAEYPEITLLASEQCIKYYYAHLDVNILKQQLNIFEKMVNEYTQYKNKEPSHDLIKERLENEVQLNREIYESFAQQVSGTHIRQTALNREAQMRYKVISPAFLPLERIKPKRRRIMMIALFLGMSIGLSIIIGLESIDVTFKRVEDISDFLNVPVIATIPKIEMNGKKVSKSKAHHS